MARPNTTGLPYLILRPDTGKYAYFRTLPEDYRSLVAGAVRHTWTPSRVTQLGGRTIKISLQTGDERTAKDRWSVVHSQIEEHIARAVSVGRRPDEDRPLEPRADLTPAEHKVLAGQIQHDLLAEDDAAWGDPNRASPLATVIAGILAGDPKAINRNSLNAGRRLAIEVESNLTLRAIRDRNPGAVADDIVVQVTTPTTDSLMAMPEPPEQIVLESELSKRLTENGVAIEPGRGRNLAAMNLLRAKQEALSALKLRARGVGGVPTPERPELLRPIEQPQEQSDAPKLSEMLAQWRRDTAPSPKNYDDRAIYVNRFIAV